MVNRKLTLNPIHSDAEFEAFIGQFTSYEAMLSYHYGHETMKLERMTSLAADLGNPHLATRAIHVAGTKGKGSTCLILEALLMASGNEVGTYLSPHVEFLRERIRKDGRPIPEDDLCTLLNSILPTLEQRHALTDGEGTPQSFPTFFELMTALAMLYFKRQSVGYALYEVGLGGRLDATNILRPVLTAITSIGMEHTDKLGDTLASIAGEKAGVIKSDTPSIVGPSIAKEARDVIRARAQDMKAPLIEVAPDTIQCIRHEGTPALRIRPHDWILPCGPLPGPGLRDDLAIALSLWENILEIQGVEPRRETVLEALGRLGENQLPGRVEVIDGSPPVILDGAHTEESVASLTAAVEELAIPQPRTLLVSVASDKRADAILSQLASIAEEIYFTRCDPVRSLPPDELRQRFLALKTAPQSGGIRSEKLQVSEDPVEAFLAARKRNNPVVVTGSFFLVGAIRQYLRENGLVAEKEPQKERNAPSQKHRSNGSSSRTTQR